MSSSRRNSLLRLNKNQPKTMDSPKFNDLDDLDDAFDAEHNVNNPFSSTHPSSSTSKWSLNEQWRKFQQIIDSKDKQTNQNRDRKDLNSQELANFSTDDLINDISDYSIHEGEEIQEGDTSYVDYADLNEETTRSINVGQSANNGNNSANNLSSSNSTNEQSTIACTKTTNNSSCTTNSTTLSNSVTTSISTTSINSSTTASIQTTVGTINKDNKRDDTKTHTFLFSKMKKNSSIERLNELDDKENEKELFDKRKDDLVNKANDSISAANSTSSLFTAATKSTPTKPQLTNRTPTKSTYRSSTLRPKHQMNRFKDLSEESSIDGFNTTDSSNKTNLFNRTQQQSTNVNVDEPIPSLPYFMSFIVNVFRERLNFISVTTSFCTFFLVIFAIQLSPLSSFANGFLIGLTFSILFLVIVLIYVLNYIFKKIDYENELHARILTGKRWEKFPAYKFDPSKSNDTLKSTTASKQQTGVYEGWFFELVYSKKLGVDRMSPNEKLDYEKMPETKLQLTYIKLEGTIMRVYVPKPDQSKKINVDKVNFLKVSNKMTQHIYDFSKMNTKKVQLWLPKNIINKKKYLWSRKFPFILVIEETNKMSEKQRTPFNLILFCRTNRDKEEWQVVA